MIIYILLIVLTGLLTLIALGLTIGGLVKKNTRLWIGSLIAFVFLCLTTVYCGYAYAKATIDYLGSDEFLAETKKKAENAGKTYGNTVSGAAQGLESTLDDVAIAKLAEKAGKIVGSGVKAVSKGVDESAGSTTVFADESADKAGIRIGRAEQVSGSSTNEFGLFLEFKSDINSKLNLTAYDSKGIKQDIASLEVKEKAGKAKVYVFRFEHFPPGLNGYCILTKE